MPIDFREHAPIKVRRMALADADHVIALVNEKIASDEAGQRKRRLGPVSSDILVASFDEFSGLSVVLENHETGAIVGCALITVFEPVEGATTSAPSAVAEAAKLTVGPDLLGTRAASILHALRIVAAALQERLGQEQLTLYYNVLSGNDRQLDYIGEFSLEEVEPDAAVAAVLGQRRAKLNLSGQTIRTFVPTTASVKHAVKVLLDAVADRVLSRINRNLADATIDGWPIMFEHPLLTDELPILMSFAEDLRVGIPKQIKPA